jgi:hypothetical protein
LAEDGRALRGDRHVLYSRNIAAANVSCGTRLAFVYEALERTGGHDLIIPRAPAY